jgi:hypothetical protein
MPPAKMQEDIPLDWAAMRGPAIYDRGDSATTYDSDPLSKRTWSNPARKSPFYYVDFCALSSLIASRNSAARS